MSREQWEMCVYLPYVCVAIATRQILRRIFSRRSREPSNQLSDSLHKLCRASSGRCVCTCHTCVSRSRRVKSCGEFSREGRGNLRISCRTLCISYVARAVGDVCVLAIRVCRDRDASNLAANFLAKVEGTFESAVGLF